MSSTSCSRSRFPLVLENSLDGTAELQPWDEVFRRCIRCLSYLFENLGVLLLSATKIIAKSSQRTDGNLSPNVSMGKRQAPRCGLSLACVRQQCHWRSEYPEFCLNVEESSSLHDSEKKKTITCNEAPLSTMYVLSLECIAKPVAVFFTFL